MRSVYLTVILLLVSIAGAQASELATFESFYKQSSSIGWIVAGLFVVVAVVGVVLSGGTASPVVAGIGSWIGGTMGLSGAAATKAGLALLGGGSVASGGFGMLGGMVVITAALTFSTEVVFDYTIGKAVSEYRYSDLVNRSKKMVTLPLPLNDSGPKAYKAALEILEKVDNDQPLHADSNAAVILSAIKRAQRGLIVHELNRDELSRLSTLLAVLNFIANDYELAKKYANDAIGYARTLEIKRTLPAFIYAVSSLYDEHVDFETLHQSYFRYAVLGEPDNPLIPVIFSIYMDRLMLRVEQGALQLDVFDRVATLSREPVLSEFKLPVSSALLGRYFFILKLEQQKILSITGSESELIRKSPKASEELAVALNNYGLMLKAADREIAGLRKLEMSDEDKKEIRRFAALLGDYANDVQRLIKRVEDFGINQRLADEARKAA